MKRLLPAFLLLTLLASPVAGWPLFRPHNTGLKVKIRANKEAYSSQESIGVAILLSTAQDRQLQFTSGQIYDLYLSQEGRIFWRLTDEKMFIQSLTKIEIKANDPLLFCEVIDLKSLSEVLKPGEYKLTVEIRGTASRVSDSVSLLIK